jgi:hypothetical protein
MQVEQKRACASCGSGNAPDAGFCWRCLVPLTSIPPSPGASRGAGPSVLPPVPVRRPLQDPATRARISRVTGVTGVIVSLVAAAVGYLGVQYLMGRGLALPDTLAGADRLTDPGSQRFERSMADEGDRYGIDAEAGVYGAALAPEFFVILVDGAALETTDQLFDALITGFSQAGAVVIEGGAKSGTRRGSDYRCVGAVAGAETAVACMWRDEDNVGIVLAPSTDVRDTRQLLWTVHDTIVS